MNILKCILYKQKNILEGVGKMKSSKFNVLIKDEKSDAILLFNSFSLGMQQLDADIANAFTKNDFSNLSHEIINELTTKGYLVNDEIDEISLLKHNYELDKYDQYVLDFTIAPTMGCNLKCSYCFEEHNKPTVPVLMDSQTQDNLIKYMNSCASRATRMLKVVWFGGEPLLGIDVIKNLTPKIKNIAKQHNLTYDASMTTNGTLIVKNPKLIQDLLDNDVKNVQITLDGYDNEHNCRRMYKNGLGTFNDIISAIKLLKAAGVKVGLRINVDSTNYKSFDNLFDKLKQEDLLNLELGFGHLRNYNNSDVMPTASVPEFCSILEMSQQLINTKRNSEHIGLPLLARPCVANRKNSIIVDDKGDIYKCRTLIGNKYYSCGNVNNLDDMSVFNFSNVAQWVSWSPFMYSKCIDCNILPICMGGCTYHCFLNNNIPECNEWKYLLVSRLLNTYYKNQ